MSKSSFNIERLIMALSPTWGEKRAAARYRALAMGSAYEAAEAGRLRRRARDRGNGNAVVASGHASLRDQARQLDRNHDLSRGILNILVRNIVGPEGIGVEPQPRYPDGSVDTVLSAQIAELYDDWSRHPEVTGELNRARAEQLVCRSWLRDGDCFWQYVEGNVAGLSHGSAVPISLELLESDMCPIDYNDPANNVLQGIGCDAWGRPRQYWMYKVHPGEPFTVRPDLKVLDTAQVGHIKMIDRIGQRRGVSIFASVLTRLDDLKDYEESERVAARIAASMAAYIRKGEPGEYAAPEGKAGEPRELFFQPGIVFDDLRPGEDIGMIDSKRPNPNAATWRDGQIRAVAAGADVSASSAGRNYNGTYSSQRQELVEQWSAYGTLSRAFIDQHTAETYRRIVDMAVLSGRIRVPRGMTNAGLKQAVYVPPSMPWIDPYKEVTAFAEAEDRNYISGPEIVRKQGRNPADVIRAQKKWREDLSDAGLQSPAPPKPLREDA